MTDTRTITLGGRDFAVPPLPLRINMKAYPLCRQLTTSGVMERSIAAMGVLDCSEEEMTQMAELALLGAMAADKNMTREAFEDLPVKPGELLDAFFLLRYQTGAWIERPAAEAGAPVEGEATGAETPLPTSISEESSPS